MANTLKKNRVGRLTSPDFKTYYKLQQSIKCGFGKRTYKYINETEQNAQKYTYINEVN